MVTRIVFEVVVIVEVVEGMLSNAEYISRIVDHAVRQHRVGSGEFVMSSFR